MVWKDIAKGIGDKTAQLASNVGKAKQETTLTLTNKRLGSIVKTKVRRDIDGDYYISNMYSESAPRFTFDSLTFGGSNITQETVTKGKTKQQSRAGSALAGGLMFGTVGSVVGASRKKKGTIDSKSTTTHHEKPGKGSVYLRSADEGTVKELKFIATQAEFNNIERFFK